MTNQIQCPRAPHKQILDRTTASFRPWVPGSGMEKGGGRLEKGVGRQKGREGERMMGGEKGEEKGGKGEGEGRTRPPCIPLLSG